VALFFLSGLTSLVGDLAALGGPRFNFLWLFFVPEDTLRETALQGPLAASDSMMRLSNLAVAAGALYAWLLARFGLRGLFDLTRPWRLLLLLLALAAGALSGFRSFVVSAGLLFATMFFLEGLHRTRYLALLLAVVFLGAVVVLPQAEKLPLPAQRALCFLPGKFNYVASQSAATSLEWRLEMWKDVLPEVPKTLFRAKGWGLGARDFYTGVTMGDAGIARSASILAGNYHNGPLSVIMPFGLYGAVAFVWFLAAGLRVLHRNWKFGTPALRHVNTLLLAGFAAQVVFFFVFFGALESDMAGFVGTLGLSVALNGPGASLAPAEEPATGVEFNTEYIKA
jgi:O-antigen ligase